jgi:hypothetical protein
LSHNSLAFWLRSILTKRSGNTYHNDEVLVDQNGKIASVASQVSGSRYKRTLIRGSGLQQITSTRHLSDGSTRDTTDIWVKKSAVHPSIPESIQNGGRHHKIIETSRLTGHFARLRLGAQTKTTTVTYTHTDGTVVKCRPTTKLLPPFYQRAW